MKPHNRVLLALLAGAAAGVAVNLLAGTRPWVAKVVDLVTQPLGRMWLSALIMVVIPLILATLSLGVAGLGSLRRLGRIGLATVACFLALTILSTALGILVMNLLRPGASLDPGIKQELMAAFGGQAQEAMGLGAKGFGVDLVMSIIPRNPVQAAAAGNMLAVIFFALMAGVALAGLPREKAAPMTAFLDSLGHVTIGIIGLVMKLAPLGVFCLIFSVTARFGLDLLVNLAQFFLTVIGTMALFQVAGYSLVLLLATRLRPGEFFRKTKLLLVTAFTTSSSNATLPTTLRTAREELGVPAEIAAFVLPLGATMNMNGTALFEGATVLFLAQVFGVDLTLPQQGVVVAMSVISAIGVAGVPGGSIPLLMMVLGTVGVPPEGIAIVLGVDRVLDMCRTVLNVSGDVVTALVVTRLEGLQLRPAGPGEA